jgi:septum formation protein
MQSFHDPSVSSSHVRFILASGSLRRAALLRSAGFLFDVDAPDLDESRLPLESPEEYVRRLARAKAAAVAPRHRDAFVVGADTTVLLDHEVLGKPRDDADARSMLLRLSGREHEVLTGVALQRGTAVFDHVEVSRVQFVPLSDADIDWYIRSGEPHDKAGAYAIQGLAARFVDRVEGSYDNVVGLPIAALYRLIRRIEGEP